MGSPSNEYHHESMRSAGKKKATGFLASIQAHVGLAIATLIPPLIFGGFAMRDSLVDLGHAVNQLSSDVREIQGATAQVSRLADRTDYIEARVDDGKAQLADVIQHQRVVEQTIAGMRASHNIRVMSGMSGK